MRLVLTLSALERAIEVVRAAHEAGKTVEKLIVSQAEMVALLDCPVGPTDDDPQGQRSCLLDGELFVCGVPVEVEGRAVAAVAEGVTA